MQRLQAAKAVILLFFVFLFIPICLQAQVRFIKNEKQWDKRVLFRAEIPGGRLFVEKNMLTYNFVDGKTLEDIHHNRNGTYTIKGHVVRVKFLGADPASFTEEQEVNPEYYNYFIGSDPSAWASGVKSCSRLFVRGIYKGIDLELFSEEDR